jgi:hypothetical protein
VKTPAIKVETYMIIVEKQHHQEPKWQSHEHPLDIQIPEVDHPVSVLRWLEGLSYRHMIQPRIIQSSREVRKADPEQRGENEGVVGENAADTRCEERAAAEFLKTIDGAKVQDGDDDGQISPIEIRFLKEVDEFFYTLNYVMLARLRNIPF